MLGNFPTAAAASSARRPSVEGDGQAQAVTVGRASGILEVPSPRQGRVEPQCLPQIFSLDIGPATVEQAERVRRRKLM